MQETQQGEKEVVVASVNGKEEASLSDILKFLIIVLLVVAPIRYFIFQPFIVRGASMEPNFINKEYLIIDELSYILREPRRGESVVFRYPLDTKQFFIKRIVGLPEERVKIEEGKIKIFSSAYPDGLMLTESYLGASAETHPNTDITLNEQEYFVLGDNRNFSYDSRGWGALQRDLITGRVFLRAWPLSRFGIITSSDAFQN